MASPPATPSVSPPAASGQRMQGSKARSFVPRRRVKITNAEGVEINLDKFRAQRYTPSTGSIVASLPGNSVWRGIEIKNPKEEAEKKKKEQEAKKGKQEARAKAKRDEEAALETKHEEEERIRRTEGKQQQKEEERIKDTILQPPSALSRGQASLGDLGVGGSSGFETSEPGQMQRTANQGGSGSSRDSRRTRNKKGDKRQDTDKQPGGQAQGGSVFGGHGDNAGPPLGPVAPLQVIENRWGRKDLGALSRGSPEFVDWKVKGLLAKITTENFDSISDQIIAEANKSEKEKDGRTLVLVIRLVFEKAIDEATLSEMYARLCRKMMEQISPQVQDDGIKNAEGKPIAGGQLFRKYLFNRCQEDFERGWVAKDATAPATSKSKEGHAVKADTEKKESEVDEVASYSNEYYTAQKARRQGLGLIRFIGELFKQQMLTERIMHECVKKLLGSVENPEEEEIESLCTLLTTVGQSLDTPKARAHMDVYFSRMKELTRSLNVSSRMQSMLQDVIELRERKWASRNTVATPTTLKQIHEQAARADQASKDAYMSRTGSRRGIDPVTNRDGWAVTGGGGGSMRAPTKAYDLSKFGQISNKGARMTLGPISVFNKKEATKRESLSRSNSSADMFQMLQNVEAVAEASTSKGSRPPSHKASVDLSHGGMTASSAALEEAFSYFAEFLDDIVYDAPKAPIYFALMLKGAGFSDDQRIRITSKSEGNGQKVFELSS
ncbi:hypothetical protein V5O48_003077 [Marasmius crinis-equi]|uniref:MIF4G domain-containing protein n=1 Tax=Marasmius crinis-equi TaxID=585013 RepID=A0ABR3FTV9_9AGAR